MTWKDPAIRRERQREYYAVIYGSKRREQGAKYRKENQEKLAAKERTAKRRFNQLIQGARHRGLAVDFDFLWYEQFMKEKTCAYCEDPLPETGHGLDRKNSKHGYSPENCVPCCTVCNEIRGHDNISYEEMLKVAKLLRKLRTTAKGGDGSEEYF